MERRRPEGWRPLSGLEVSEEQLRPWLLPAVYERLQAGQEEFLAELRPATAVFLHFQSLDHDRDEQAERQLNEYITWVQRSADRLEGTLLQVTIGDKGSYLYVAFGGPLAHENDTERALRLALILRSSPAELAWAGAPRIGISRGEMRAGAYGSRIRRTYGIQGDEVNVAARLMQAAAPGQILVSAPVHEACGSRFVFLPLGALKIKGKDQPVEVFALSDRAALGLPRARANAGGKLVGRAARDAAAHVEDRGRHRTELRRPGAARRLPNPCGATQPAAASAAIDGERADLARGRCGRTVLPVQTRADPGRCPRPAARGAAVANSSPHRRTV